MERNRRIEELLGQSAIFDAITKHNNASASYLIEAPAGRGKHYLSERLKEYYSVQPGIRVLHCCINRTGVDLTWDFAPFVGMLVQEENITKVNYSNLGKPFIELIPYVGKCISQLMSQKKVYAATFNSVEAELLMRLERVIGAMKPIFLCEEVDHWDKASMRFLQKLLTSGFRAKECVFICTCTNRNAETLINHTQFDQRFEIGIIAEEDMEYVIETSLRHIYC